MCEASGQNFNTLVELRRIVGRQRFMAICDNLGGQKIRIPLCPDTFFARLEMLRALKSGDIHRLTKRQWIRALTKKHTLSAPYIRRVVNGCFRKP